MCVLVATSSHKVHEDSLSFEQLQHLLMTSSGRILVLPLVASIQLAAFLAPLALCLPSGVGGQGHCQREVAELQRQLLQPAMQCMQEVICSMRRGLQEVPG